MRVWVAAACGGLAALSWLPAWASNPTPRQPNLYQPPAEKKAEVEAWYRRELRQTLIFEAAMKRMDDFVAWYKDQHHGAEPSKREFAAEYRRAVLDFRGSVVVWRPRKRPDGIEEDLWHELNPRTAARYDWDSDTRRIGPLRISGQYLMAVKESDAEALASYNEKAPLDDLTLSGTLKHESFHGFLFGNGYDKAHGEDHHSVTERYEKGR